MTQAIDFFHAKLMQVLWHLFEKDPQVCYNRHGNILRGEVKLP